MQDKSGSTENAAAFIARWQGQEGGQERANYALFLTELCDVLGVDHPEPAGATRERNDYVFERVVTRHKDDGEASGRIDLYKRDCFVLEAKQSRLKGAVKEALGQPDLFVAETSVRGRRGADRAWDVLMLNAKRQAEEYARALPTSHGWPPFILVCDVGHCIEVYADFSGQGKNYTQFPDRQSFRIYLEDLRDAEVRERLHKIWFDPISLDPAQASAKVTRDIAKRLAEVSLALEKKNYSAENVAMFLMRCLFTMFAEDVGLLPEKSFKEVLEECEKNPEAFVHDVGQLWEAMDLGTWAHALRTKVKRFNGEFFKNRTALPLGRAEISELRQAASYNWKEVDPSIFGTLLEQALDPEERKRLGAHYTPRSYVERLVVATVIEPLREEWRNVQAAAETERAAGGTEGAAAEVKAFHDKLCETKVLDPACGTGNFLYVSLEMMKRLEGEVLEALLDLGGQEALRGLGSHSVDPHQFYGLEVNPRAAAIAELVLWIGYLQWHYRTKGGSPDEPILRAFKNIKARNAVLTWDGEPHPTSAEGKKTYPNARRYEWPSAEFIVGNPPFIGGKDVRARVSYAEALWAAHPHINESADFVMYWWDHAAELLTKKGTPLRRFGLVTTNSISQVFQRRVMERHLQGKRPVSLVMAIPDHPWTKATQDAAAVRIAMTVAEIGHKEGVLREVVHESELNTDAPKIAFKESFGLIHADLTQGIDLTRCKPLRANEGISARGMVLHGKGFIVTRKEAERLGLGRRSGLEKHIREYRNGRDLMARSRDVMVIDLYGLTAEDVRNRFPEVYQHVKLEVKEKIIIKDGKEEKVGRDWNPREYRRDGWWLFGENVPELRKALSGLNRYIATVETMKHRVFLFLDGSILPDNKLVAIATDDAYYLGVLSSTFHVKWSLRAGGWLGVGNDPVYVKTECLDPFPFPDCTPTQKDKIRKLAVELDSHRKHVLSENPNLTLTALYNVLEEIRAGKKVDDLNERDRITHDLGLVSLLKDLHAELDAAVAGAYRWPVDLSDEELFARLLVLNKERADEEKSGRIRWLRPDYQLSRFAKVIDKQAAQEQGAQVAAELIPAVEQKLSFPAGAVEQTAAVFAALTAASEPLDAKALAAQFKKTRNTEKKVADVLASLARLGYVKSDDGKRFALRRVA